MGCNWNMCRNISTWEMFWKNEVRVGEGLQGDIRSLVNTRGLELEFARIFHETVLEHILTYDSESVIWRKKER